VQERTLVVNEQPEKTTHATSDTSPSAKTSGVFHTGITLYRMTVKRIRPLHRAMHWMMAHVIIPFMEKRRDFRTLPDDPFWFRLELLTYRHEAETVANIRQALFEGATMLDIGGHVGYYTLIGAQGVGKEGRIIAFEPHPRNHATLVHNARNHPNVTIKNVALAEEEGTAQLHDYLMMSASGSLHYDESLREVQQAQMTEQDFAPRGRDFEPRIYEVRTAPVDDILAELGVQNVDVVKMDIEGAEMGALRGMRATIERSPRMTLIMEYNPLGLQAFDNDPQASLREVLAMGFQQMYVIEADGTLTDYTDDSTGIAQLTQTLTQNMGVVNLLFKRNITSNTP
jgi:FkbM family methyltransferase